jgi:hypothetical protein
MLDLKKEIIIRSIKILDIGYITALYLVLGIFFAKLCDNYLGKFNENDEKRKTLWQSLLEVILYSWFIGVFVYFIRNTIPLIPFPLNGVYGFDHLKVKEVTSASAFLITFVYFQEYYQEKLKYIHKRILSNKNIF